MTPKPHSQADGSGDSDPEPFSHIEMPDFTDNEVQRSLGRMEGKLDTALATLMAQGDAILSLQLWRARAMGWIAGVSFVSALLGSLAFKVFAK